MFDRVGVFSATVSKERAALGEKVTEWLREHPGLEVVDKVVRQSSDHDFHCISIVLFCKETA